MHSSNVLLFFASACLAFVIVLGASTYYLPPVRHAAEQFLMSEDGSARSGAAAASFQMAQVAVAASSSLATDTADTLVAPDLGPKLFQYRLLRGVDECTLNTLGKDGWEISQVGGNVDLGSGAAADCKRPSLVSTMDWILFVRKLNQ